MPPASLRSADLLATFRADLDRIRREVIEGWRAHTDATLSARPAPRKWSAIDCIEHVGRANSIYLRHIDSAIERAGGGRPPVATFHPGAVGGVMFRTLKPRPATRPGDGTRQVRMKMPTLGSFDPTKDAVPPDATETLELFGRQLEQMNAIAERMERVDLHVRTKTLLGPLLQLRIGDALRYLVAHTDRHIVQAERAIDQADSHTS